MPYIETKVYLPDRIEVEKVFSARYGSRIKHAKKCKPTPEDVRKVNERNAQKHLRRLIMNNFTSDDWHTTLTYYPDRRPDVEQAKKNLKDFIDGLRKLYKKTGCQLKWVAVTEYEGHAIHHHIIINEIGHTTHLVRLLWQDKGQPNFTGLYENGDYDTLAAYFIKETRRTRAKGGKCYSRSRNLVEPVIEKRIVRADSWRKKPVLPRKEKWYVKELTSGVSELTGLPYQYYTLLRVPEPPSHKERKKKE